MNIFINKEEGRIRAGWRLLVQFALFILLTGLMMLAKNAWVASTLHLYNTFVFAMAGTASVWIAAFFLDKRDFADYGIAWDSRWKRELAAGMAIGGVPMLLIFAVEWSAGWVTVTGFGWERPASMPYYLWIGTYLISMAFVGFYEELIFRGYQILNMVEGFHPTPLNLARASATAIIISSAIFAILHAGNPNANLLSTFNIILAGIVLALPFLITGRLAVSIGMHFSWNFMQGGLLGLPVSGTRFRGSLLQVRQEGADFMTGGAFGPEAGMLGLLAILLMLLLFYLYISRKQPSLAVSLTLRTDPSKSTKTDESSL